LLYKKKKFDGQIALYYFAWYGLGRMFIEGLRTDPMMIPDTGIRSNQLLSFLIFAVAVALIVLGLIYVKNHPDSKLAVVGFVNSEKKAVEEDAENAEDKADVAVEETEGNGTDN
jgi:prolipoprotein diacylglyceryltransferase